LDWRSAEAILGDLVAVGINAERAAHPHDPEAGSRVSNSIKASSRPVPDSTNRRVYAFDLANFTQPEDVIAALRALNQRRQIRTFTIGLAPNSTPAPVAGNGRPAGPSEGEGGVARTHRRPPLSTPNGRSSGPPGDGPRRPPRSTRSSRSLGGSTKTAAPGIGLGLPSGRQLRCLQRGESRGGFVPHSSNSASLGAERGDGSAAAVNCLFATGLIIC
jgi:hypothetical protein